MTTLCMITNNPVKIFTWYFKLSTPQKPHRIPIKLIFLTQFIKKLGRFCDYLETKHLTFDSHSFTHPLLLRSVEYCLLPDTDDCFTGAHLQGEKSQHVNPQPANRTLILTLPSFILNTWTKFSHQNSQDWCVTDHLE